MRIKRLELQGFKSFRDKTIINFDAGITGIVGPNGCGKSNVVDAFFWVMGEQSPSHLRGSAMSDLIFNGCDKSPPANFAEVTLILEMPSELAGPNAPAGASAVDISQAGAQPHHAVPTRDISLTRKLFRSGDSEYYMNKTPCRLRDIQELFMDTGVGSRGYSIIQQGQIAKIVQAKPEDRRTMIEEVAGIVKYKARRKEAARKLEGTQQNLLRVTDIINELELQKRQMERQADKARKYKEWKERLQGIELSFNALKWEEFSEKLGTLEREMEEYSMQDTAITTTRETEELQIATKRMDAAQASKVAEEFQDKWMRIGQDLNSSENNLKYLQRNLIDLSSSSEQLRTESEEEKIHLDNLRSEHETLELENASIEETFAVALDSRKTAETQAADKKKAVEELEKHSEENKNTLVRLTRELSESQSQSSFAQTRLEELSVNVARLDAQKAERESILTESKESLEIANASLAEAKENLETIREQIATIGAEAAQAQTSLSEERRKATQLASEQARSKATLLTMEDQKRRHEASSKGVKSIFQNLLPKQENWKNSVHGTLADALNVEKGYETAIETALGRYLDLILTNNASIHGELANALKQENGGRAAFADITKAKNSLHGTPAEPVTQGNQDAIIGPLSNFVKPQGTFEGSAELLNYLSAKIFVVKNKEAAVQLAEANPELSFVSMDGELYRGGWYLEGGDLSQVSGAYVSRNREIAELAEKLISLDANLEAAHNTVHELENRIHELAQQKRNLEDDFRFKQGIVSQHSSEEASLRTRAQEAERALRNLQDEVERLHSETSRLEGIRENALSKIQELEVQKLELETEANAYNETFAAARAGLEEAQQAFMEAKIREASVTEQKATISSRLQGSQANLSQRTSRLENMLAQMERKRIEATETEEKIAELHTEIEQQKIILVEAEKEYRESRDRLEVLNNEIEQLRTAAQEHSKREREVKDALSTRRMEADRASFERDNLAQNTFERYGIILAEYATSPETLEQVHALRAAGEEHIQSINNEVTLLKEKIRKLGEVNTGAIEEYDQIVERYNFLSTQKSDLEKSMADLQSTIDKINKVSKERFTRAFEEVNAHFMRVFPVIFGGGHANLTLTNPEDFLETGVDIMAQPPGKKPQNINLLSGGEKTLTAISLLFAIFLVKPSPFCLLDEVDAPLDDANIGRFNALLKEMAKRSQFIIITHNKRTMELNDKLYGVTMETAGMSKMVSIQMSA